MKRYLFIPLLLWAFSACGIDTLTRAQIYNFNVGDTFDYYYRKMDLYYGNVTTDTKMYRRYIINSIYYSANTDTLFVLRKWTFPNPVSYIADTLVIDSLNEYEVNQLTLGPGYTVALTSDTTRFNNRLCNITRSNFTTTVQPHWPVNWERTFVAGVGLVASNYSTAGALGRSNRDSTMLIYYAKGNETWGNPYYHWSYTGLAEEEAEPISPITVQPCLSNNTVSFNIAEKLLGCQLTILDPSGRQCIQTILAAAETAVDFSSLPRGLYIWRVSGGNNFSHTGKLLR